MEIKPRHPLFLLAVFMAVGSAGVTPVRAGFYPLALVSTEVGRVAMSMDGLGSVDGTGLLQTEIPLGSTIERAILYTTTPSLGDLWSTSSPPEATFAGETLTNPYFSSPGGPSPTAIFDVTSILTAQHNPAAVTQDWLLEEGTPMQAAALAVTYSNLALDEGRVYFFAGALDQGHTNFSISFPGSGIDTSQSVIMSLGIDSNHVEGGSTGWLVDVNGERLTSIAGGTDDGTFTDGALATVGGVGDDPANPPPTSTDYTVDDELYTLNPFIEDGDTVLDFDFRAGGEPTGRLFALGLQVNNNIVPEPTTGMLVLVGGVIASAVGRRRRP